MLGTRGSPLAVRQTEVVAERLRLRFPDLDLPISVIQTEGDRVQNRPLSVFGDKAVFVGAIERALLRGEIDLAVHSLKDVSASHETEHLVLAAFSPRADPRDVLVTRRSTSLMALPEGATVGTGSPRRRAELLALRPDLRPLDIRGNVDTRLRKVREGDFDAVILAAAGLARLGRTSVVSEYLPLDTFVPDAGQAIIAVQAREGSPAAEMARSIDAWESRVTATAERALVRALGAGCRSPVGAHATLEDGEIRLRALTATEDLRNVQRVEVRGSARYPVELGRRAAALLQEQGGERPKSSAYTGS